MMTKAELLRREIGDLVEKRVRNEILQSHYDKQVEKLTLELSKAIAQYRLIPNETILCEHHIVRAHTKLTGAVLQESEQEIVSLWATDNRVLRLRALQSPGHPALFQKGNQDSIEEITYGQIRKLKSRREFRKSELLAGLLIVLFALLFQSWLQLTSIALMLIGIVGAIHGAFFPTRWIEILTDPSYNGELFVIYTLRKKSAKQLIRMISAKMIHCL